jgi:DNA-directed RNA polymerase specialized sigma24 family protein
MIQLRICTTTWRAVRGPAGPGVWSAMGDTGMVSGAPDPSDCSASGQGSRNGGGRSRARIADAAVRQALGSLYQAHYCSLVRLAALLTGDAQLAEQVVADSLLALASCPRATKEPERALFHLRQQVVIRSRRAARSRSTSRRGEPHHWLPGWEATPSLRALGSLPPCEREAIVLGHYLDLGDSEIAAVMGASRRAVRGFISSAWGAILAVNGDGPQAASPDGSGH